MRTEKRERKTIIIKPSILRRGKRLAIKTGRKLHFLIEECLDKRFRAIERHLERQEAAIGPEK
jgi:hypothetical protein